MNAPSSKLDQLRALDAPPPGPTPPRGRSGAAAGGLTVVGLLLWKFKALALLALGKLKFVWVGLKLLKLGKFVTTGWTMLAMIWVYSLYFGWAFAAGLVLLILLHEMGHGAAARQQGLRAGAPVFIPFVGAFIALRDRPRSTFQDFVIGAGGPIAGALGGAACVAGSRALDGTGAELLLAVGYVTLIMNLFNLVPVWQLDGARMTAPLTPLMWAAGLAAMGAATLATLVSSGHANPLALLILLVGVWRGVATWRRGRRGAPRSAMERLAAADARSHHIEEDGVTTRQRWLAAGVYFALATALVVALGALHAGLPDVG